MNSPADPDHPPVPPAAPYGPAGYQPYGPPPTKNRSGMRRAGKWMTWIGVIILVGCVAAGVVLAVFGFGKVASQTDNVFEINTTATRSFSAGDSLQLFAGEDASRRPNCRFDGPAPVQSGPDVTSTIHHDGQSIETFRTVTIPVDGSYTITCDEQTFAAPALTGRQVFAAAAGLLIAILGGGFGFLLTIIGIVLWVVGARSARR